MHMETQEAMEDGGVRDYSNPLASKIVRSREIVALETKFRLWDGSDSGGRGYFFQICKQGGASFLLTASGGKKGFAQVDAEFLDKVQRVIEKHDLIRRNGISQTTSGLPVQFSPCSLNVDYASGERLYFCVDNDPEAEWAKDMKKLFLQALD